MLAGCCSYASGSFPLGLQLIHGRILVVLSCDLRTAEVKIATYHLQCCMAENFPKGENITTVQQIVDSKGVSAQMSMKALYA